MKTQEKSMSDFNTLRYEVSTSAEKRPPPFVNVDFYGESIVRISKYLEYSDKIDKESTRNLEIFLDPNKAQSAKNIPIVQSESQQDDIIYKTENLKISIRIGGDITFHSAWNGDDSPLITDKSSSFIKHGKAGSNKPFKIGQRFLTDTESGLFGLGQHQQETLNWRGQNLELGQHNTIVSVPVLLSTAGFAIIWENLGESFFSEKDGSIQFKSTRAEALHYWIIVGSNFDDLISKIRSLTGPAPMYSKWGYGFIQSRNRYWNWNQVFEVLEKHRALKLPIDVIVVDYIYYGKYGVGSHKFDEEDFPNPEQMIQKLHHEYDVKLLLSIWPTFAEHADTYDEMKKAGYLLKCKALGGWFYDPYNPDAGEEFWKLLNDRLYSLGVDAWWLDASEPDDEETFRNIDTYFGPGLDYLNIYSLLHTSHVYNGQLEENSADRPFLLTRSAFIGQQRHATATWSGDVRAKWDDFRKQIPSGLNFCATGIPYWCTDIGGYKGGWCKNPLYRELFIRWFQYGTFCPIFRSHGRRWPLDRKGKNEIWSYGRRAISITRDFMNLRYRLLPYIYSTAWKVYSEGYTMMRMLPFDYPEDQNTFDINDQFLFGPSLMVAPVTRLFRRKRDVYLPGGIWYDFWTGERYESGKDGRVVRVKSPLNKMPIFVKGGSIIPLGPIIQFTGQTETQTLEVRVYPGTDCSFDLYFDDGESRDYINGGHSTVRLSWSQQNETMTADVKANNYFQEPTELNFKIYVVKNRHQAGIELDPNIAPDQEIIERI